MMHSTPDHDPAAPDPTPDHAPTPPSGRPTSLDPHETNAQNPSEPDVGGQGGNLDPGVAWRHRGWWHDRQLLLSALERAAVPTGRLDRFALCGSNAWVLRSRSDPGRYRLASQKCRDRFCRRCAADRANRLAAAVREQLTPTPHRFATLTLRSSEQPLAAQIDRLYHAFRELRRRRWWRARVRGGAAFLEVTWGQESERWHPHLHLVIDSDYLPQSELSAEWHHVTRDSHVVDIRIVRDPGAVANYVTKYAAKPLSNTYLNRPEQLDEAIRAFTGRRLMLTFGTWHGIKPVPPPEAERWETVAPLRELIARRAAGDDDAARILDALEAQSCPRPRLRLLTVPPQTGPAGESP